jgi:hypothetical protein
MTVIVIGVVTALSAVLLHGILVRRLPSRFYVMMIGACCLAALLAAGLFVLIFDVRLTGEASLLIAILAVSLVAVYALLFMGIAWDSPTLALANEIIDQGAAGMPVDSLDDFVRRHPFVHTRIDAMVESGVLADDGLVFSARSNLGSLVRIIDAYRRVFGRSDQIG